jgi:hypothetical protein
MLNSNTNKEVLVMFTKKGKLIGMCKGNSLYKNLYQSKHLLIKPRGWASDVSVLKEAERLGLEFITINELENGVEYKARINDFWLHGIPLNRGHGDQLCLPLEYWSKSEPGKAAEIQMSLQI